jgi:hypothetical protein
MQRAISAAENCQISLITGLQGLAAPDLGAGQRVTRAWQDWINKPRLPQWAIGTAFSGRRPNKTIDHRPFADSLSFRLEFRNGQSWEASFFST